MRASEISKRTRALMERPTGHGRWVHTGTPKQALDTALGLYLDDPTAWQLEPPKD